MLTKNSIEFTKDSTSNQKHNLDIEELNSIVKQQPNRRVLLGFRFHLGLEGLDLSVGGDGTFDLLQALGILQSADNCER
mgnify:CR=1 FL=1